MAAYVMVMVCVFCLCGLLLARFRLQAKPVIHVVWRGQVGSLDKIGDVARVDRTTGVLVGSGSVGLTSVDEEPPAYRPGPRVNKVCVPVVSGIVKPRKGQIGGAFGKALSSLVADTEVKRVIEIGTWFGGGSTPFLAGPMQSKANCSVVQRSHRCCEGVVLTFEVFPEAHEYAKMYLKDKPVWAILGTTVSVMDMLSVKDMGVNAPGSIAQEHFRLYYDRDKKLMASQTPQLRKHCEIEGADLVLIDGNEYTGWAEFMITVQSCQPKYIALHDTGTLKTRKVERYMVEHPSEFPRSVKGDIWSVHRFIPHRRLRVISYSLWGNDPRYLSGLANIELAKKFFPGWTIFFYVDDSLSDDVVSKLRQHENVEVHNMQGTTLANKMSWRFLPAGDRRVERFIVRDADSRLSLREKLAVDEWIQSGMSFHVMRDHPSHAAHPMSGGMWGGTHAAMPNILPALQAYQATNGYLQDMSFLRMSVWPVAKRRGIFQHDEFSCSTYGKTHPFPAPRNGTEHVGGVVLNGTLRKVDVDILIAALSRGLRCKKG